MDRAKVLFISHRDKNCGVYQFGKNVAAALVDSKRFDFEYVECANRDDFRAAVTTTKPVAIIYNHHSATAPWLTIAETRRWPIPQIGIIHEVTQEYADTVGCTLFDYHVAPDPTLLLRNPRVFKTGRLIPEFHGTAPAPSTSTFGSFGFATPGKNFDRLVRLVQDEFDEARIRLNIPPARFADVDGSRARAIAAECRAILSKPGIDLQVSHDFLSDEQLLQFLASNSLNAFFYDDSPARGVSSTLDFALAVNRPIAVSSSGMFRHLRNVYPSIVVGERSLGEILATGSAPLERLKSEWSAENLRWDYERIVSDVLERESSRVRLPLLENRAARTSVSQALAYLDRGIQYGRRKAGRQIEARISEATRAKLQWFERGVLRRLGYYGSTTVGDWVPASGDTVNKYRRGSLPPYRVEPGTSAHFNRILDDDARSFYGNAIHHLENAVPDIMARKMPRANVQQAFVLDTVARFVGPVGSAKLLSVGSYEDTAAIALIRSGYDLEEIDPVLNYNLATFISKPSVRAASYDIVLSTSVIEHVQNDEEFVSGVAHLLKPGGVAILTCDFRDGFRPGDPMPSEDRRLYTTDDLTRRLLKHMPGCVLADEPSWAGSVPDFEYGGTKYSFAGFVVRKLNEVGVSSGVRV